MFYVHIAKQAAIREHAHTRRREKCFFALSLLPDDITHCAYKSVGNPFNTLNYPYFLGHAMPLGRKKWEFRLKNCMTQILTYKTTFKYGFAIDQQKKTLALFMSTS